jgi:hypothetical protein
VLALAIESVGMTTFSLLDWFWLRGYTTGYQGAKGKFYGLKLPANQWGEGSDEPILHVFQTSATYFSWDLDAPLMQKPDLIGEMTSIFIPSETIGESPSWIPDWLIRKATTITNPRFIYDEWQFEETQDITFYRMENWRLVWFFTFGAHGHYGGHPTTNDEIPSADALHDGRNSYHDVEVWMEIDLTPIWYFSGAKTAYFAVAKTMMGPDGAIYGRWDKDKNTEYTKNTGCAVVPESAYTILPMYYEAFGEGGRADKESYEYEGQELNPDLFTDRIYTYFTLQDFGINSWWDDNLPFPSFHWRGDVVTCMLYVDIFVIGEWEVQDIDDLPDWYGRSAQYGSWAGPFGEIFAFLMGTSEGRFLMLIILAVIGFFILIFFAPWVILLISQIFGGGRRR